MQKGILTKNHCDWVKFFSYKYLWIFLNSHFYLKCVNMAIAFSLCGKIFIIVYICMYNSIHVFICVKYFFITIIIKKVVLL